MNQRHHRIRLLCATRHHHLPPPAGTRTHDQPGPSPSHPIQCPDCHGLDPRRQACSYCEGHGTILVDRYLHERPPAETVAPVDINYRRTTMTRQEIDGWLDRIRTGGTHWAERAGKPYRLLERALSRLQTEQPGAYEILHVIYWRDLPTDTGHVLETIEPQCIEYVDEHWPRRRGGTPMPVPLPRWLEEQERRHQDEQIRRMARPGVKYASIAAELGIDVRTVQRAMRRA